MANTILFMWLNYIINRKIFFKGSAILVITTILSYGLGLLRDRMLAHAFGASRALDAYNAAFTIPDLLLNIFVAGALSAAFIPIFSDIEQNGTEDGRTQFINSVLNGSLLALLIAGGLAFIFAPQLAHLTVPGFDEASRSSYVSLVRILLLSPLIFAVSNTLGSILVARERFFWFGISAALYNAGIIFGVIFFAPSFGIRGVAYGALLGALLHLFSRIIGLWRFHFNYHIKLTLDDYCRRFLKLMVPKMIGHPVEQLTFLGFTIIASGLGAGAIVVLNLSRNFQSMPVAVIGINFALAMFPTLSRAISARDFIRFRREVWLTGLMTFAVTALAALVLYLIRYPLIEILIGGGEFGPEAVNATAKALGVFALAIPTESVSHLLARAFYALKDSITPTLISIAALLASIGFGYLFSRSMGVSGLALGFFVGSALKTISLKVFLSFRIRSPLP